MKEDTEIQEESGHPSTDEQKTEISKSRRSAVTKLAYASPVIAGILFSQRAAAQFSPPPPPPTR